MATTFEGYVVRGLLSMELSRGPETLEEQINLRWPQSVDISDHGWAVAWFSNVNWLTSKSRDIVHNKKKLVLAGHSFGATAIIMVAQNLAKEGIEVDLLCPIDPAYQYSAAVPHTVKRCVAFVQHTPGQLGQGEVTPDGSWSKVDWDERHVRYLREETHLQIIDDPFVHGKVIEEIAKIAGPGITQ